MFSSEVDTQKVARGGNCIRNDNRHHTIICLTKARTNAIMYMEPNILTNDQLTGVYPT